MARVPVSKLMNTVPGGPLELAEKLLVSLDKRDEEEDEQRLEPERKVAERVENRRRVPEQKPGRSEQEVQTPPEFIAAVVARWGPIAFDLSASAENTQAPAFFDREADALKQDWTRLKGNLWLNPEFGNIAPFAEKCRESRGLGSERKIFLLTPAGVSTNWFYENVYREARVIAIQRLRFVGHEQDYPKDLILSVYGDPIDFEVWRWKDYGTHPLDRFKGQDGKAT